MIKIEKYKYGEENAIEQLIRKVYDEFVAPDYTDEGNKTFYDFIIPKNIVERVSKGSLIFTAKEDGRIIGMIELKKYNHLSLLFVDKNYHRQGISHELFNRILKAVRDKKKIKFIDVNSSIYAVSVYLKLGFKITGKIKKMSGIKFVPMKYDL